ncbi:MAG: hypothetical protein HYT61_02230 [Candidatus Yanofskybacteria bacterium]|nr:hypothetical protein [Candidatus Yanofskybacteria bacterium]
MENQTGLIGQDVLATAIQEAEQEKIKKLELKKQEKKEELEQQEKNYIIHLNSLPDQLCRQYLKELADMTPQHIDRVLNDTHSKIKVLRSVIMDLKKWRRIYWMTKPFTLLTLPLTFLLGWMAISRLISPVIPLMSFTIMTMLTVAYDWVCNTDSIGKVLQTLFKNSYPNIPPLGKLVTKVIACCIKNIAELEVKCQKLVE